MPEGAAWRWGLGLGVWVATGCFGSGTDHERLGDRAYVQGAFVEALSEYRLALLKAAPDPRLRGKAGIAALNTGDLVAAAEEYRAMARESDEPDTEAVDGLERVGRAAIAAGNVGGLQAALDGLREFAEGRAIGSFARELARDLGDGPQAPEALTILPYAAAAAPDVGQQDSLMFVYGLVLRRLNRCEEAVRVFESLLRRGLLLTDQSATASRGAARCALSLGRRELSRGFPESARGWFERAAAAGGDNPSGRSAYVGLGDVWLALGRYGDALDAYDRASQGLSPRDSLYRVVQRKIRAIGDAGTTFR